MKWLYYSLDKLTGMHENTGKIATTTSLEDIKSAILNVASMGPVDSSDASCLRFVAVTFSGKLPLLLTVSVKEGNAFIRSNCEKMVFGSMLVKLVKETIASL